MGLIERMKRITSSRTEAFLQSVEDPELLFPQLIKEMKAQIKATINAEAKAAASLKSAQRKLDESEGQIIRFEKGAELALSQGDEEIAREALAAQIKAEKNAKERRETLERSENALKQAREAKEQLVSQLEDLKARKDEIITRSRSAKTQKKVSGGGKGGSSILDQVSRMESKIEEDEAEIEIQRELTGSTSTSLDERLRGLTREAEIRKRLDSLKNK